MVVKVLTDSTSYLSEAQRREFDIRQVSLQVAWGAECYREVCFDGRQSYLVDYFEPVIAEKRRRNEKTGEIIATATITHRQNPASMDTVSGRSKPARRGRIKTSHFEVK